MKECTTHHYACDCREAAHKAEIASLQAERYTLAAKVAELERDYKTNGVCAIAADNPNVASYCNEWESRAIKAESKCAELQKMVDKKLRTKDGVLLQGGMNIWITMDGIEKSGPCRVQLIDGEFGAFIGGSLYYAEWCYSTRAAAALASQSAQHPPDHYHLQKETP